MSDKAPPKRPAKRVQPERSKGWNHPLASQLRDVFGESIEEAWSYTDEITCLVASSRIVEISTWLKSRGFSFLVDLAGLHYPEREKPFTIAYLFHNMETSERIRLKINLGEDEPAPTLTGLFKTTGWMEREAFDMFGIRFEGHPDLRRILTWDTFQGYPLRKDFPVEGIDTGAAIYPDSYPEGGGPVKKDPPAPKAPAGGKD